MVSDLPRDLSEEVLCRIPWTCVRKVRSTCKKWNTLSKNRFVAKKHLRREAEKAKEFMVVVMMDYSVYLMGVNLSNKDVESCSLKLQGKLTCPTDSDSDSDSDQIDVCKVFHCDGLLLCVPKDHTRLVVWNPYCGKPLWIEAPHRLERDTRYLYAIGYDKSSNSHKILRFREYHSSGVSGDFTIYDLGSSWRDLDITPRDWRVEHIHSGVSVNGNAYWLATEDETGLDEFGKTFLVGFDFTRETFGPRLPLPFQHLPRDTVSLSAVRGGKLAAMFQPWDSLGVKIWVTNKIEPDAVSWESKVFLSVSLKQSIHHMFQFMVTGGSFFIEEEMKVAVFFDEEFAPRSKKPIFNLAYIIGVDGSIKRVDLGESARRGFPPLACSYLPSLIQPLIN